MESLLDNCNEEWSYALVKELVHQEVRDYFIALGSRSTPLVLAAERHPLTKTHFHFDERGLAFAALGFSRATRRPTAIIVTSGTAVANLYPAIIEASMDEIPILILAADRPIELLQMGSNQTIDQIKIFGSYLRAEWILPPSTKEIDISFVKCMTSKAVHQTLVPKPGPVMIDCMFRKPLTKDTTNSSDKESSNRAPHTTWLPSIQEPAEKSLKILGDLFSQHEKGVILVGKLDEEELLEEIFTLSLKLQWPLFTEPTSNLRNIGRSSSSIPYYNSVLKNTDAKERLKPTIILHLGDQYVSSEIEEWIRSINLSAYVHISPNKIVDIQYKVSHRLECSPALFAKRVIPFIKGIAPNLWLGIWKEHSLRIEEYLVDFFDGEEKLKEPTVIHALGSLARSENHFFFGSSLPIRYADSYFYPRERTGRSFATRGASGIDGNIAQAIGIAKALDEPMICVIGDLTFLHDANSLAMLTGTCIPFTLIILNNFGSGIFSLLPVTKQKDLFDKCFRGIHQFKVAPFAKTFSIEYAEVETIHEFTEIMKVAPYRKTPLIIEVISDVNTNENYMSSIDDYLKKQMKRKSSSKTFYRDLLK
jgi:2-succinyl-5-enolpyruvyl-6-hydroxy-3-cyclohexene-1-carboxylate synthase